MSHQLTFTGSEFNNKRRKTRKEIFLSRMDELMPWDQLEAVIEPFYSKAGKGRRPYTMSTTFRIGFMCFVGLSWTHLENGKRKKVHEDGEQVFIIKPLYLLHFAIFSTSWLLFV